jgi:hypothetical protein
MSIKTNFFDGIEYYASDFVKAFEATNTTGLINKNDFLVKPNSPSSLNILVEPGRAFVNGYYIEMDTTENIPITANTSGLNRIDLVCLKLDLNKNITHITVIQGTPSSEPVDPIVPVVDGEYYIELATVKVYNNKSSIEEVDIYNLTNFSNSGYKGTITDFDSVTEQGVYSISNNSHSTSPSSELFGTLFVRTRYGHDRESDTTNYVNQLVISSDGNIFVRVRQYVSVGKYKWSAWKKIAMQNDTINTVKINAPGMDSNLELVTERNSRGWEIDRFNGHLQPLHNGISDIGTTDKRVRTIYCINALNTSDKGYKENIEYIGENDTYKTINTNITTKDMLDFVANDLCIAKYNYIDQTYSELGFIAQDVINTRVGKEVVVKGDTGLMYSQTSLIMTLVGSIKELKKEIEILKAR